MEWFDDIFDILNDDDGDDDKENKEAALESIMEEYNQDFDFDYIDTNVDEEEMMTIENDGNITNDDHHHNEIFEEQILSQEFGQLFAVVVENNQPDKYSTSNKKRQLSTPSTPDGNPSKKIIRQSDNISNNNNNNQIEQIAEYLQATNEIFDEKMACYLMNSTTTITMEDLRQLANLRHNIGVVNLGKELWSFYLKLGTGQWKTQESEKIKTTVTDRQFWPKRVKEMAVSSKLNKTIDLNKATEEEKQKLFENILNEYLHKLNKNSEQYQAELDEKKENCASKGFTDEIEKAIETFVQEHGIQSLRMKCNYKIAILEYEYDAELLEREYLRLKPSDYQIEIAKRLYVLRYEHIKLKQGLIEFKQRILCNKPTKLMNSISLSMSSTTSDTNPNEKVRQQLTDQEEKEVEEKITNMMAKFIAKLEEKSYQSEQLLDKEIDQICVDDSKNRNESCCLTANLVHLIYRRFNIIKKRLEYIGNFRIDYLFRSRYGYLEDTLNITNIGFSPTMIIDTPLHLFTIEQLKLLKRGPTYIPPCQMYVSSSGSGCVSINDMIEKQFKLLKHNLNILFAKYDINPVQSMFITKQIKDEFMNSFSISLPLAIEQRAIYEKQLVESIREHLNAYDLILRRTADQRNVFYLGYMKDFQEKINDFMNKTDVPFEISEIIDDNNLQQTHEYLTKIIKSMNCELDKILNNKFYKNLLQKFYSDIGKVQLPYLYFLPDISKSRNSITVKPIIVSQYSVTSRLGRFLDGLLRPVIQRQSQWTTFVNGADFIRKLIRYTDEQHLLRPTTVFATIKISNFITVDSHSNMLAVLERFLYDHLAAPGIETLSIKKIIALTTLFLNNNQFYYDNKIYRFVKGGPSSLPFIETLSNIYVFEWQKLIFKQPSLRNEFYGRCKNQIFFTWNERVTELRQLLIDIGCKNQNVQLETVIGRKIQFLHAQIENQNGTFYSRVYHDPNIQKYTLPYVIGDSKLEHSHWLRSALIRTVRYCTSVDAFHEERLYLELTCLANGYSIEFVDRRINHFFTHFNAISLRSTLDQQVYNKLRHRLFNFVSEQQKFYKSKEELEKKNERVQLTYSYQYGSKRNFNEKLQKILSPYLNAHMQSAVNKKIKIILITKQQYSLNALLSRQKPFHPLLNK